ncbi:AraC family transcriptional regulator [Paraburkholderia sediminicola]|uniref:AraC family transcriptional regulator n=1 Tax=Paraburkholderia rhynchosiae TaxID=487049 RepID=A0ACC7NN41_9BURK
MSDSPLPTIRTWATSTVPWAQRVAYFQAACATALVPFGLSGPNTASFCASIEAVDLGPLSLMRHSGSAHMVRSGKLEIQRRIERNFNVLATRRGSWRLRHREENLSAPHIAAFTDSQLDLTVQTLEDYDLVNLQLPVGWVRQWLPEPQVLLGRRITPHTPWGRALTNFMTAPRPESMVRPPLPPQLIADYLGALLALAANEIADGGDSPARPDKSLADRIEDCIRATLRRALADSSEVAHALDISPRTLHRHLASRIQVFGIVLISARVAVAARMLESRLFSHLTAAQIGQRAEFADPSHFARTFRRAVCIAAQIPAWRTRAEIPRMTGRLLPAFDGSRTGQSLPQDCCRETSKADRLTDDLASGMAAVEMLPVETSFLWQGQLCDTASQRVQSVRLSHSEEAFAGPAPGST